VDFPDSSGRPERQAFSHPIEIVEAWAFPEVLDALARVERHAFAGRFAVGFVAYDAAPAFDEALRIGSRAPTPLLWFGIYDGPRADGGGPAWAGLAATRPESGSGSGSGSESGSGSGSEFGSESESGSESRSWSESGSGSGWWESGWESGPKRSAWEPHVDRGTYDDAIERIKRGILDGAFYQVNHTLRLRSRWRGDPVAVYERLRGAQPASHGIYVDTGPMQIASASPELFFARSDRRIVTRPMKGTARRGRWGEEDRAAAHALRASAKDRAENVMIVDLVRNDLGRIARTGSVTVPSLFDVERHPTVWQMTSTIEAELRDGVDLGGIFSALFPCGSVIGAPKIAAAAWIAEHEAAPRGVYCGAMGVVRPGGDCTFNVAIRTLVLDRERGTAEYGAGGGITIDSSPGVEYDEVLAKAAVLEGPAPTFALLETLRLRDGRFVRRDRHLRRLADSADYFGFPPVVEAARSALDERADAHPSGEHRVRLLVDRDGSARTEAVVLARADGPGAPVRCALARGPVSSRDPFLFHKTTNRRQYEEHARACGADEVILWNERGELTECSIGNVVLEIAGERLTPPIASGLLAGVFREELLECGQIAERVLRREDLRRAATIWRINSLREWTPLRLVD